LEFKAIHAQYDSTGELLTLEPDSGRDTLVLLDEPENEGTNPQLHLEGLFCNYLVISVYFSGEISPYFHPKAQLLPLSLKKPVF
jgi:hypothetical protein